MQDTKLFETIPEVTKPWHIARVELKIEDKRVDVWMVPNVSDRPKHLLIESVAVLVNVMSARRSTSTFYHVGVYGSQ